MTPGADKTRRTTERGWFVHRYGTYCGLTYDGQAGFSTGWIYHTKLRLLRIAQPYLGYPISAG